MADGAIRRLIKMCKKIDSFRKVEYRDQIQLLKSLLWICVSDWLALLLVDACMECLILRGAMSYDPKKNVWIGPTPQSSYTVKMDAMKETQDKMFDNSIR